MHVVLIRALSTALLLVTASTASHAVIPVSSEVGTRALLQICWSPCDTYLVNVFDEPIDSQGGTTSMLSVSADATADVGGCFATSTSGMTAIWNSASSGSVSAAMDYATQGDSAGDLGAINRIAVSPGWTYEFTPEGDGSFEVTPNNPFAWEVKVNDGNSQSFAYPNVFSTPLTSGVASKIQVFRGTATHPGFCRNNRSFTGPTAADFDWTITEEPTLAPYTLTTWDPDDVFVGADPASLVIFDATVGITDYAIESFEDPILMPGLTIEGGEVATTATVDPLHMSTEFPDSLWDYSTSLGLNVDASLTPGDVVFALPGGIRSFGIGIGDVESNVILLVNGQNFGFVRSLPNFKVTNNVPNQPRQIYIRIDSNEGFPDIAEVRFAQLGGGSGDILYFDRLAISPASTVPIPGVGIMGGVGAAVTMIAIGIAAMRRRGVRRRITV